MSELIQRCRRGMQQSLWCGVAAAGLLHSSQLFAQVAATPIPAQGAGDVQAASADGTGLQDIIVTATRFSQNLQKAAVNVSVLGDQALQQHGVSSATDLTNLVPGLVVGKSGVNPQIYLRGLGDFTALAFNDAAVGFNLDQVSIARAPAISGVFYDVERLEVLKGPQGTLYGRNSTGGALNVITNNPKFDKLSGNVAVEVGNYGTLTTQGAINLPISDTIAARAAFQTANHDGYLSDGTNDQKMAAGRVKLLFRPSDRFDLLLTGDYAHQGGRGTAGVLTPLADPSREWLGPTSPEANAVRGSGPVPASPLDASLLYQDVNTWGLQALANWKTDFATLTVIGAYRHLRANSQTVGGGFYAPDDQTEHQASLEARLSHSSSTFKWVIGGYYFNERLSAIETVLLPPIAVITYNLNHVNDRNYAFFGDATYSLTDRLRVLGGIRRTSEKKTFDATLVRTLFGAPVPTASVLEKKTFNVTNWKAGIEYDLAPTAMAYFSASTGFRSGGFYIDIPGHNTFEPEKITAFALGLKSRMLDNRLQLNAEAFLWNFNNKQINGSGYLFIGGVGNVTTNAGKAQLKGIDVDLVYKVFEHGQLTASIEYNDAKYKHYQYDAPALPTPPSIGCPFTVSGPVAAVNCNGRPLERAPKWSGSVGYEHVIDLENGGKIQPGASIRFSSKYFTATDFLPSEVQKAYQVVDLNLTYRAPSDRWYIGAYARNVTNEFAAVGSFQAPIINRVYSAVIAPRTFGGRFGASF